MPGIILAQGLKQVKACLVEFTSVVGVNKDLGARLLGLHLNPPTFQLSHTLPELSIPSFLIGIEGEIIVSLFTLVLRTEWADICKAFRAYTYCYTNSEERRHQQSKIHHGLFSIKYRGEQSIMEWRWRVWWWVCDFSSGGQGRLGWQPIIWAKTWW